MNALLEPIKQSPKFKDFLEELMEHWETEQEKRRQFYKDITPSDKWEFINGEIVVHSPSRNKHLVAVKNLNTLLNNFVNRKNLGVVYAEKALVALTRNDYEPDLAFFPTKVSNNFTKNMWKFPAPQFAIEVLSDSTEKNDRGIKFNDYADHGVEEYWIVDAERKTVEQFYLGKKKVFQLAAKKITGDFIESLVIKNFKIEVDTIFDSKVDFVQVALNWEK